MGDVIVGRPQESFQPVHFSDSEKTIIDHFFTNSDKDIYWARNLDPEVCGTMMGFYSRSEKSVRETFLDIIVGVHCDIENEGKTQEKIKQGNLSDEDKQAIFAELASAIDKMGEVANYLGVPFSEFFGTRSRKFLGVWADKYGHDSLKDGAHPNFCAIENVSLIVAKAVEDEVKGDYQEKSSRYMRFSPEGMLRPREIIDAGFGELLQANSEIVMTAYQQCVDKLVEHIKKTSPRQNEKKSAYTKAVQAAAFDNARYLLPLRCLTSLGAIVNARHFSFMISRLMVDPHDEVREVGRQMLEEGKKVMPTLLENTFPNQEIIDTREEMELIHDQFEGYFSPAMIPGNNTVRLVHVEDDLENKLFAAMLQITHPKNASYEQCYEVVQALSTCEKEALAKAYLGNLKQIYEGWLDHISGDRYDRTVEHPPGRGMAFGRVRFEIDVDDGAFADIHRHRRCNQTRQVLTDELGYEIPPLIAEAGLKDVFVEAREHSQMCRDKMRDEVSPWALEYMHQKCDRRRLLFDEDVMELFYTSSLRTKAAGHFSYRKIFSQMLKAVEPHLPIISQFITVDNNEYFLGRMREEERYEQRLEKRD